MEEGEGDVGIWDISLYKVTHKMCLLYIPCQYRISNKCDNS